MVLLLGTGRKASYKLLWWLPAKTQSPNIPLAEYTAAKIPLPTHSAISLPARGIVVRDLHAHSQLCDCRRDCRGRLHKLLTAAVIEIGFMVFCDFFQH
jgi:hypothetical protein